jgi:hypothetical protein
MARGQAEEERRRMVVWAKSRMALGLGEWWRALKRRKGRNHR